MINISENAVKQVKSLGQNLPVRISVVGGGCSGMSYRLSFDPNPIPESDKVFTSDGVTVVVDPKSYLFINGATLEYSGGLNGTGFQVVNPKAKANCGCGQSFNV